LDQVGIFICRTEIMKTVTILLLLLAGTMEAFSMACGPAHCSDYYLGGLDTAVETARSGPGLLHGGVGIAGYWIGRTFENGTSADEGELRFSGNIALAAHLGKIAALELGLGLGGIVWNENSFGSPPDCNPTGEEEISIDPYFYGGWKLSAGFDRLSLALCLRTGTGYCLNAYEDNFLSIPTVLVGFGNPEKWTLGLGGQGIGISHHRDWVHVGVFLLPLFSGALYGGPGPSMVCPSDVPPKYRSDRFNYAVGVKVGVGRY
jgi:hypothetical protein